MGYYNLTSYDKIKGKVYPVTCNESTVGWGEM
jgi:hypothetical protein